MQPALTQRLRRGAARSRAVSGSLALMVMATTLYLPMRELAGVMPFAAESESSERSTPTEQEERDGTEELRGGPALAPLSQPPQRRVANKCDRDHRALSCSHLSLSVTAQRARSARPRCLRLLI